MDQNRQSKSRIDPMRKVVAGPARHSSTPAIVFDWTLEICGEATRMETKAPRRYEDRIIALSGIEVVTILRISWRNAGASVLLRPIHPMRRGATPFTASSPNLLATHGRSSVCRAACLCTDPWWGHKLGCCPPVLGAYRPNASTASASNPYRVKSATARRSIIRTTTAERGRIEARTHGTRKSLANQDRTNIAAPSP
jgi:hypothetical protein